MTAVGRPLSPGIASLVLTPNPVNATRLNLPPHRCLAFVGSITANNELEREDIDGPSLRHSFNRDSNPRELPFVN
jgi:hypothetical protein